MHRVITKANQVTRTEPRLSESVGVVTDDAALDRSQSGSADSHQRLSERDHAGRRFNRRALFTGGAVGVGIGGVLGALGTLGASAALGTAVAPGMPGENATATFGAEALTCHGPHQAGIVTPPGAHIRYVAYQLRPEVDASSLQRLFRLLTGDIEGLTSGESPLADPEPELAERPARLSITVGVGQALVDRVDPSKRPGWLAPLPAFALDQLAQGYDGGDLLLVIQSDDVLPLAHAHRMLHRDVLGFAEPLWSQQGFRQARGADESGRTMRNLMGQIDGTANPDPHVDDFDSLVWLGHDEGWLEGGSAFVLRRIRMELDTWDMVDRPGREASVGRRLADGSPLSAPEGASDEHTPADFTAKDSLGLSAISVAAHIRRAHSTNASERIFRRAVNYDDGYEAGLLFGCYQQNPLQQFVPIQQRLDDADMLNEWVTHVGSSVFAMLPGFAQGETLGQSLFA